MTEEELLKRLNKAIQLGGSVYDFEDVKDALRSGQMQAFWNDSGLVITQIHEFPKARYLQIVYAAGTWPSCLALQPQYLAFAAANGCKKVTCYGRRGWRSILPRYGWVEEKFVSFTLAVEGTEHVEQEAAA